MKGLHQDFVASMHSDFFQGQKDRVLFYWPSQSGATWQSKPEEEEGAEENVVWCKLIDCQLIDRQHIDKDNSSPEL